jgi:hypothetical protein
MRKIDETTGEILTIKPGGMYAPFPIPAYQVLARLGDHHASRVLTCLVSHLGSNGRAVFPNYSTIAYESGMGRNSIKKGLDILVELGFIKIIKSREGKKKKNLYIIQEEAYLSRLMNKYARSYRDCFGACRQCGAKLDKSGYKEGPYGHIHIGCGGSVKVRGIPSKKPKRDLYLKSHAGRVIASAPDVVNCT